MSNCGADFLMKTILIYLSPHPQDSVQSIEVMKGYRGKEWGIA
jgi:hypothetical protein